MISLLLHSHHLPHHPHLPKNYIRLLYPQSRRQFLLSHNHILFRLLEHHHHRILYSLFRLPIVLDQFPNNFKMAIPDIPGHS